MREAVHEAMSHIVSRFSHDALSSERLSGIEEGLRKRHPAFDGWPTDGELGLILLGWSLGPGFRLKGFSEAVEQYVPRFDLAAKAVTASFDPTWISLGGEIRKALRNAWVVLDRSLDDVLYWPVELTTCLQEQEREEEKRRTRT